MEFPYLASTSVSLRGIFWLYMSKDGSSTSLADLYDLVVLLKKYSICIHFRPLLALTFLPNVIPS